MAEVWKGASVAQALTQRLQARAQALRGRGIVPTLAILRVGDRPDDLSYERAALKRCETVGVAVHQFLLPADCTKDQLLEVIAGVNASPAVHGLLMFRPLPDKAMEEAARAALDPKKDVDGMTPGSLASLFAGKGPGYPPCTAQACLELLDHYGVDLTGKRCTVVGRSLVIGKPVAMLLQARNATVTMCHTRTLDLPGECRRAEVLVAAAGKAGLIGADCLSPGQTVLDVGINVDPSGMLRGDVDFAAAEALVGAVTPVPGGVGSVTTAVLCKHVIQAAEAMGT